MSAADKYFFADRTRDTVWRVSFEVLADKGDPISAMWGSRLQMDMATRENLPSVVAHVCAARIAAGGPLQPRWSVRERWLASHQDAAEDRVFGQWAEALVRAHAAKFPRESPAPGLPEALASDFERAVASDRFLVVGDRGELEGDPGKLDGGRGELDGNRGELEGDLYPEMYPETDAAWEKRRAERQSAHAERQSAIEGLSRAAIDVPQSVWLEWARTHFQCSEEELALLREFIAVAREEGREFRESVLLLGLLNACPADEEARERLGSLRPDLLRLAPPRAPDAEERAEVIRQATEGER